MATATLGKRTRDAVEAGKAVQFKRKETQRIHLLTLGRSTADPNTPSKRPRRSVKPVSFNDENVDPEAAQDDDGVKAPRGVSARLQRTPKKLPVTPSTPRKRDALASQPATPRHAVMSAGKLFKRLTPASPASPSAIQTIYHSARQLFAHGSEPGKLIGRESEREQLTGFLQRCRPGSKSSSGCLYVSGPPGTGKSAMMGDVLKQYSEMEDVRSTYVNCMSIKSSKDLYNTLLSALDEDGDQSEADAVSTLQAKFCPKKQPSSTVYLVTLDEIDHILTLGLESLYRLFEWSLQKPSRLVLVGVANALDLTDRFLPRLKAKNLKPELLPFLPYNAGQIKNIIITRLKSLMPAGKETYVPFIHPAAIELCSRKVASQTGDLRKAFEICRRSLDLIEAETRSKHEDEARTNLVQLTPTKKPLGEKVNGSSPTGQPKTLAQAVAASLRTLTPESAPRASIGHLNKVTAAAFSNGTAQRLKTLNLQQKAALCSLVAYENRVRETAKSTEGAPTPSKSQTLAPTIRKLFDTYCLLCTRDSVLHPLSSSEFREVAGSLETLGLVNAVEGKNGSFVTPQTPSKRGRKASAASGDDRRVASAVSEKDMESIAEGIGAGILRSILSGDALD